MKIEIIKREELECMDLVEPSLDLSEEAQLKSDMNECVVLLQSLIMHRHGIEHGWHDADIAFDKCQKFDNLESPSQFFRILRLYLLDECDKCRAILKEYHHDYIDDKLQERTLGEIYG